MRHLVDHAGYTEDGANSLWTRVQRVKNGECGRIKPSGSTAKQQSERHHRHAAARVVLLLAMKIGNTSYIPPSTPGFIVSPML